MALHVAPHDGVVVAARVGAGEGPLLHVVERVHGQHDGQGEGVATLGAHVLLAGLSLPGQLRGIGRGGGGGGGGAGGPGGGGGSSLPGGGGGGGRRLDPRHAEGGAGGAAHEGVEL